MPSPNPRRLFARRGTNGRSAPKATADTDILTRTPSQPQPPPATQWPTQAAGSPLRASMNLRKGLQAENSFTVHRRRHSLPTSATPPGRASKGSRKLLWFRWRRRAASPSATTSPNSSQPIPHMPPPASSGVKETLAKTRRGIAALYADTDTECYNRARNDACTCASCMAIADAKENSPSPSFGREQKTARSAQTPPSPVKSSPRCEISMSSSSPILIPVPGGSERTSNSNKNPGEDNGSRARPMARTIARMKKGDSIGDAWECEKGANVEAVTGISRSTLASLPRQTFNVVNVLSQHVRAGCAPQGQSLGLSSYSTYCPRWALLGTPGDNWAPLGTAQRARLRVYATEMRRFVERSLGYTLGAAEELAALFAEIAITCPVPPSYEPDRPPRFQLKSIAQGELAAMSVKEEQEFCSRMREYLSFLEKCTTVPVRVIHEMNADSLDFIHALAIAGSDRLYHGDYQDNAEFTADFGSALRRSNTLPSHSSKWSSKFMARNAFPGELAKPWKPLTKIERAMLKSHITDIRKQVETFVVHSPFRDHPDVLASVLAEISLTWPVPLRTEPTRPPRWHTRSIPKADWDLTSFSDRQIYTTRVKKYLQFLSDTMRMTVSDIKRLSSDDFDRVHAIAIFKHIEFTAELTSYPPPPMTSSLAESRQRKTRSATTDPQKERERSNPLPNIVSPSTSVDSRQWYDGYGQGSRSDGYDQVEYRQTAQSKTQTPSESSDQAYVNETVETPVNIEADEDKRPISVILANKLEHEAKETKWYLHLASKNVDALSYTLKGISRSPEAEDEVGEVEKLDGGILESSEKSSSNEGSPRVSRKSSNARAKSSTASGNALESVNSSLESEGNQSPPRKVNPFQHMRDYSDVMPETQRFLASKLGMPEELLQACTKHELAAILSNHFLERRAPLRVDRSRPPRWSFKNLSEEKLASLTRKQCSERKKGMRKYLERISSILGIPLGVLREMDAEAFDCAHALATERAAAEGQKIGSSALSRVNTVASIAPNSLRSPERKKRSSALVSGSPQLPTEGRISSTIIEEESKEKFFTFISEHSGIPKSDLRAMNDRDIAKAHAVAVREYDRRTSVGPTRSPLASPVVASRNVIPADILQSVPPGSKVVIVNPAENAVASNCNDPNCKLCPAPATSVTAVSSAASPSFMSAVVPNGYGESSTERKPTTAENEQRGEEEERESKEEAQLRMSTEINTEKNRTRFSISTIDQVRTDSAQTALDGHLPTPNVKEIIKHYNEQWAEPPESSKTEPPKAAGPAKVIQSTANTVQQYSPSNGMFVVADTMVSSVRASVISKGSPQPSFPQIRSPTKEDRSKEPEPDLISLGPPATKSGRVKPLIISPVPAFLSDDQTSSPQLSASSGSFSSIDNDERLLQKSIAAQSREKNDSGSHTKAISGPISNYEDEGDPGQTSAEEEYLSARQSPVASLLHEETQEPMCTKEEESVGNEVSVPKNLSTDLPSAAPAQANGDGHPERSDKGSVENMQEESGDKVENPIEKWKGQVLAAHTNIEDMHRPQKQSVTFQEPLVIKFSQTE